MSNAPITPGAIHEELERVRADFHALVTEATPADLRRPSSGTRWTNGQLLFHMFFGYLIVRRLLPLVRLMGRLPDQVSRSFARALEAGTGAFHVINYQSDRGAARVIHGPRLIRWFDRTLDILQARLKTESEGCAGPRDAHAGALGSLLPGLDEPGRDLPLRHPALRPPPPAADAQPSTVNPLRFTDLVMQLRFQRAHRARLLHVTAGTEEGAGRAILIPGMCRYLDSLG